MSPSRSTVDSIDPWPVRVLGSGIGLPRGVVPTAPDAPGRAHGVARRRVAAPDESASSLGAEAARAALDAAGLSADRIGCLVSACGVMERALPCQAALIQRALGLGGSGIRCFDVNASCLSFLAALDVASSAIVLGRHRTVLIVSAEVPSVGIDPADPATADLFGDGAAAVLLGRSPPPAGSNGADAAHGSALLALELATYADHADACTLPGGGTGNRLGDVGLDAYLARTRFRMDGRALYRAVARRFPGFVERLLARAGVGLDEIRLVVPHQASGPALEHLRHRLRLPPERVVTTLAEHGNLVAASLPHALHVAIASKRLHRGQLALLLGTGAGVCLGGAVLRY